MVLELSIAMCKYLQAKAFKELGFENMSSKMQ